MAWRESRYLPVLLSLPMHWWEVDVAEKARNDVAPGSPALKPRRQAAHRNRIYPYPAKRSAVNLNTRFTLLPTVAGVPPAPGRMARRQKKPVAEAAANAKIMTEPVQQQGYGDMEVENGQNAPFVRQNAPGRCCLAGQLSANSRLMGGRAGEVLRPSTVVPQLDRGYCISSPLSSQAVGQRPPKPVWAMVRIPTRLF